jgi:hypothetical protein
MNNTEDEMNAAEQMQRVVNWLNDQDESLSFGLQSMQDAIRLWAYWHENKSGELPEYADEESDDPGVSVAYHRVRCLGYDPLG